MAQSATISSPNAPTGMPAKTPRMIWLDSLRLLAGVSMVGLHASSDPNGLPFPDFDAVDRIGPVLFRAVIYTARTELFLIISLFLLVMSIDARPRPWAATVKIQARRLLIPFAFWTVFYAFYRLIKASVFGYQDAIWAELSNPLIWVEYGVLGSVQYHMHFLPTLFGLVLAVPLYRVAVHTPILGLSILLCLVVKREVDGWLWWKLSDLAAFDYLLRAVKIATYTGYGIVAASFYGLFKRGITTAQLERFGVMAIYLCAMLFSLKLVYSHRVILSGQWDYGYDPAFYADFLMPAFLFAIAFCFQHRTWPAILSRLAPYSFGIYLTHPIFLDLLEIALWESTLSPSAFVAIKTSVAIGLTSGLVWGIKQIKPLGWTIGLGPLPNLRNIRSLGAKPQTKPTPSQR